MTEETKVEVELHDEIDNEIVEETLEEAQAPTAKGKADAAPVTEPESIASVDKAADATKQAPVPKTKAGMISAMYGKLNSMKKVDLQASYGKVMGEDLEVAGETVAETIDTTSELDALVESEATLSEEFKEKTAVIFEAAVKSKLSEEVDRLETQYKEELSEEVSSIKGDLVEKVDSYLNYVVESWMDENKVAVQNGLRTEIAETFMDKMKDLFTESYIDVPESKVDLVDELAEQVSELEEKLNAQTGAAIKLSEELEVLQRDAIIAEASRGLADTQVEKLKGLVEGIDFDEDTFAQKVGIIIESHFAKEPSVNEEVEIVSEDADHTVEVSSSMAQYVSALQKTIK
jgi:flagellar biosynthesis regulator FlaF